MSFDAVPIVLIGGRAKGIPDRFQPGAEVGDYLAILYGEFLDPEYAVSVVSTHDREELFRHLAALLPLLHVEAPIFPDFVSFAVGLVIPGHVVAFDVLGKTHAALFHTDSP